ncbi:related to UPF0768 protein YBL029C-A [Saccharomycodes ludwigii]|uniref:Related to UPF0768 protein YBL029C-A n=1 Tax=Saccharomycodes ludwigii TaxID=36035 RepID=A0A376B453_9ASCO|nr:hypothetical protein SCDLUD_000758 [Saccharomycodes ludwigii]KAH3903145.1 hypothetical protein SCDLUD_000758 [Saccharomycodes ludwigii]SSD59468.1 related to UPF0768 protein YBL029C-A [Saccharomycodes ludwigii]
MNYLPTFKEKVYESDLDVADRYKNFYCPHCHNFSVVPVHRKAFMALLWVPLFPLGGGSYLKCPLCNWIQEYKNEQQLVTVAKEQEHIKKQHHIPTDL